jgi:hypothetical protein
MFARPAMPERGLAKPLYLWPSEIRPPLDPTGRLGMSLISQGDLSMSAADSLRMLSMAPFFR